jgi:hypothetical protein
MSVLDIVLDILEESRSGQVDFITEINRTRDLIGDDDFDNYEVLSKVLLDLDHYLDPNAFVVEFNTNKQYANFLISIGFRPDARLERNGDTLLHSCARIIRSTLRDYTDIMLDVGPDYANNLLNNCSWVILFLINEHGLDYDATNNKGERMQDLCDHQPLIDYIDRFRDLDNMTKLRILGVGKPPVPDDIIRQVGHYL